MLVTELAYVPISKIGVLAACGFESHPAHQAHLVELAYTGDLKSPASACGFESRGGYQLLFTRTWRNWQTR